LFVKSYKNLVHRLRSDRSFDVERKRQHIKRVFFLSHFTCNSASLNDNKAMKKRRHDSLGTGFVKLVSRGSTVFLWLSQVINIVSAKMQFFPYSCELTSSFQESINSYYADAFPPYRLIVKQQERRRKERKVLHAVNVRGFCLLRSVYEIVEQKNLRCIIILRMHCAKMHQRVISINNKKKTTWKLQTDVMNDKVFLKKIGNLKSHQQTCIDNCFTMRNAFTRSCENFFKFTTITSRAKQKNNRKCSLIFCPFNFSCKFESIL
jgi:hypothetical protein